MNKKEIQQLMAIVRPAIIALYGRQPLKLIGYEIGLIYANSTKQWKLTMMGNVYTFSVEIVNDKDNVPKVTKVSFL